MRKALIILLLLFKVLVFSQNLVPNPSFENINGCPVFQDELYRAAPWFKPTANSSDIFHACYSGPQSTSVGVPSNFLGYQNARTGLAYAGFASYYYCTGSCREYISVKLDDSLISNISYCVEFYVSLSDSSVNGLAPIGAFFSKNQINDQSSISYLDSLPQVTTGTTIINDTANWVLVSGSFIANGGETYLTIGTFAADSELILDTVRPTWYYGSYFYIDDVSVTECPEPPPVVSSLIVPNAFSPNGDGINDFFSPRDTNLSFYTCKIYNRWGNLVFETTNPNQFWDGNYNGGDCVDGTYFYLIEAVGLDDKKYLFKGFLMLAR
jgi:gliding motility-associated-like protein